MKAYLIRKGSDWETLPSRRKRWRAAETEFPDRGRQAGTKPFATWRGAKPTKNAVARQVAPTREKITSGPVCIDLRGVLSKLRGVPQSGDEEAGLGVAAAQVPLPLSLLDPC